MTPARALWADPRVAVAQASPTYTSPSARANNDNAAAHALREAATLLGWADSVRGPLGGVVSPDARVVVKPNWVLHRNEGPWGIDPLLTHSSVIRACVDAVLLAGASSVLVGDAPLQGCDFDELLAATGLSKWSEELRRSDPRFAGMRDFRRTTCIMQSGVREASEDRRPLDEFVLFDLGVDSLLEPVTSPDASFRVTQYDPDRLARTHAPGRHQYLVAREIIAADVVVNLPKLKTHKKAGITCALKNLIGINGNKEFLPHHRVGGASDGGDCYPGSSRIKRTTEAAYDRLNRATSPSRRRAWAIGTSVLDRVTRMAGDNLGVEGAWSGNDTVWRTCLDLNRILLYGRLDGTLAAEPIRRVLHIVDAIVAGHGDGPLAPRPLPLGLLLAGSNAAAVDWVATGLLGYEPCRIPTTREAFGTFRWPIAPFTSRDVVLRGALGTGAAAELLPGANGPRLPIVYPEGWRTAVHLRSGGQR